MQLQAIANSSLDIYGTNLHFEQKNLRAWIILEKSWKGWSASVDILIDICQAAKSVFVVVFNFSKVQWGSVAGQAAIKFSL